MNIRTYRPADRPYLRNICKETAWADYKNDPSKSESVCILYNDYFTKYEPENIFVAADNNDIPVGYIICSSDYEKSRPSTVSTRTFYLRIGPGPHLGELAIEALLHLHSPPHQVPVLPYYLSNTRRTCKAKEKLQWFLFLVLSCSE